MAWLHDKMNSIAKKKYNVDGFPANGLNLGLYPLNIWFDFGMLEGNSTVTELQIRDFGLLFNHFVLYFYDFSQFEYCYKVQRYQCHHLKHKICQSSLLLRDSGAYVSR